MALVVSMVYFFELADTLLNQQMLNHIDRSTTIFLHSQTRSGSYGRPDDPSSKSFFYLIDTYLYSILHFTCKVHLNYLQYNGSWADDRASGAGRRRKGRPER